MKPQPKQKLEQLLEAEFVEAEALALTEAEQTQPKVSPYRNDETLSDRLDIPRDVAGLVGLLEERKGLSQLKFEYPNQETAFGAVCGTMIGEVVAVITTIAYGFYGNNFYDLHPLLISPLIIIPIIGGLVGRIKDKKAKQEFQQKKETNIPLIEAIDQKLSHYEKTYRLSDIALVDDPELGYSLGWVIQNGKEEFVLHQSYHRLKVNYGWTKTSEEKPLAQADIVSILKPSIQLSGDDLRSLEEGTPVLCVSTELLTSKPAYHFSEYGFIDNKNINDIFKICTIRTIQGPGEHWYKFNQVQEGKINAYLLVPEIK